jgi:hypothetical protein
MHPMLTVDWGRIDPRTSTDVKLLNYSIAKWKAIIENMEHIGTHVRDGGSTTCALCQKYIMENPMGNCQGCPIRTKTMLGHCNGTPYPQFAQFNSNRHITVKETRKHAGDMFNWLIDLRDELRGKDTTKRLPHMHTLKFHDFSVKANAAGADAGRSTIKCEWCDEKFAFVYERINAGFDIEVSLDKVNKGKMRFTMPSVVKEGWAVGIDG